MAKSTLLVHDANQWVNCPGSVQICAEFPGFPSEERTQSRLDGRASHEVAARIFASFQGGAELCTREHVVGTPSADGIIIDTEMYDAALEYSNDVLKVANQLGALRAIRYEHTVPADFVAPGTYCVVDSSIWHPDTMTLYVWDYKYGHRSVDAFENYQLIIEAHAILEQLRINGNLDQQIKVVMRVVQPRSFTGNGPIREWVVTASELRGYVNIAVTAANETLNPSPRCKTGPWCITCAGRYGCDTLTRASMSAMDYIETASGVGLSGHNLGIALKNMHRAQDLLKAKLSGLEEQAIAEIRSGKHVTGFTAEQGYGRERWRKDTPHEEIIMMADMLGVDVRKPVELDTPSQARKKGIDESVIAEYIETPKTSMKLVAVNTDKARQVFKPQ